MAEYMMDKMSFDWPVRVKVDKRRSRIIGYVVFCVDTDAQREAYHRIELVEGPIFGQSFIGYKGHFCGYIKCSEKIPSGKFWGVGLDDFDVYGGITFNETSELGGRCLGWDYNHGREGEYAITLTDVYNDVISMYEQYQEISKKQGW